MVPCVHKVASENMNLDQKLSPLRKGLLEFVVLKIVSGTTVYVADILKRLSDTEFATQEGMLYPCSASSGARASSTTNGRSRWPARPASTTD